MKAMKKVLFSWEAPSRLQQKRSKEFWTTAVSLAVLFSVILFFAKEYFLILAVFSALFAYYAISSRPAEKIKYKITDQGVDWGGQFFDWRTLRCFWFETKEEGNILLIETLLSLPKRLVLIIPEKEKKKIRHLLEKYIPYEKVPPAFLEKTSQWLAKTFPLESPPPNNKQK